MLFALLVLALTVAVSGCSGNVASQPNASSITVATVTGAAVTTPTVALSTSVNLSMTPTGDISGAGVDWTVTCQGNPVTGSLANGACGTLAPAHTADGKATVFTSPSLAPINNNVTITATVTANPSQTSTVTFTILSLPISVDLSNTTVPASLVVNKTQTFAAQVTNDPANAGVIWSALCNGSACGSFNPTITASKSNTTYTAPTVVPTGATVTIQATSLTDTSKSASTTVKITTPAPPVPVTVNVVPSTIYVENTGAAHSTTLEAIIGNDSANAGVTWTLSCGASNCGVITQTTKSGVPATYTAPAAMPPNGTVTITAASVTNPAVSATSAANIATTPPITVTSSSPPPATLIGGSQAMLAATVTNDPNNLGVNWTATCGSPGACGTFSLTPAHTASGGKIIYTAPSAVPTGGVVIITAASATTTPANPAIGLTTILAQPPSLSFIATPPSMMTSLAQAPVAATVAKDVSPGGVDWTVQCGSTVPGGCGWVLPAHTAGGATAVYTAPPVTTTGISAVITATSTADSSVTVSSSAIAITPSTALAVNFVPALPAQIQPNATVNLAASVANDGSNAGVDWQVCASGCGFFTVKPALPAVSATSTTPYVPAVPAVIATSVSGWSNGLPIPYTAPSETTSSGVVAVGAFAHANHGAAISGTIAVTYSSSGPPLHGLVQAGSQPVAGASIALYAAGTSGYASAAAQVGVSSTAKDGSFTVPANYVCPASSSQMYLVATGGSVGSNSANPTLALMTALGNCANLPSATVIVNEVTTVASAYATAPFSANDALTGNKSYLYLGASSGNLIGLANAFASVNNLVDISTGQAKFFTSAANASVPFALINTLADALNACAASSGGVEGDGSACSTLLTDTDLLSVGTGGGSEIYPGASEPIDTLQAAFNIAQHPVSNYDYVFNSDAQLTTLANTGSPFQPIVVAPTSFSVSLNFTGGGGLTSSSVVGSFAIDANGNLWITDTAAGSVIEWNSNAAALSPAAGFAAGGGPIAIDANGSVWVSGNSVLTELTNLGTLVPGSPYAGVSGGGNDVAFDAQGDLWIANGGGVSEFNNLGVELSPASGFINSGISSITAVGVDSSNNVWLGDTYQGTPATISELSNPGAQLIVNSTNGPGGGSIRPGFAADGAGDLWAISAVSDELCEIPPYGGAGSILYLGSTCSQDFTSGGLYQFNAAEGLALDGAGIVWVASLGGGTPSIPPSILPVSPSLAANSGYPNPIVSPSLAAGPLRLAIDGSGNVWVLLADNTVTEYVGLATPVATPIALGVKNKKLAAKP